MLWTVESLRMATAAEDEVGRHVALAELAAWRRQHVELKQVFSHGDSVVSVAFSPDGKTIVTGSGDKTARLWDAATGRSLGLPMEHSDIVRCVAFSPDGKTILTGSADKSARLWDAATGQPIGQPLAHSAYVISVAFSPDGKTILTGSQDRTARLWDAATGQPVGRAHGACGRCPVREVQPGRQDDPHRGIGQDGATVGRRHVPAHRPTHGAFGLLVNSVAFSNT